MFYTLCHYDWRIPTGTKAAGTTLMKLTLQVYFDQGSISSMFYAQLLRQLSCASKVQTYNVSTKKLCTKLMYVKAAHRILVKQTPARRRNLLCFTLLSNRPQLFSRRKARCARDDLRSRIWSGISEDASPLEGPATFVTSSPQKFINILRHSKIPPPSLLYQKICYMALDQEEAKCRPCPALEEHIFCFIIAFLTRIQPAMHLKRRNVACGQNQLPTSASGHCVKLLLYIRFTLRLCS